MFQRSDIERAVLLSYELANSGSASQEVKAKVTSFLRQVEADPEAWRYGLELFLQTQNEYTRFYGLSRLVSMLSDEVLYEKLQPQDRVLVRDSIVRSLENDNEKAPIRNKLGVIVALLIKRGYPSDWPEAFDVCLAIANRDRAGAVFFLRVLEYVTEEIVAEMSERALSERTRNTAVKDAMRLGPLQKIVEFCHRVIVSCVDSDPELVEQTLVVLREYIVWMDINLILNDKFVPMLYRFVADSQIYRAHALKCFSKLVRKGMEPANKVQMLQQLDLLTLLKQVCDADNQVRAAAKSASGGGNSSDSDDDDDDEEEGMGFRENVSSLVADIGVQYLLAREKLEPGNPLRDATLEQISGPVAHLALMECLDTDDFDAQEAIQPFLDAIMRVLGDRYEAESKLFHTVDKAQAIRHRRQLTALQQDEDLDRVCRGILSQMLPVLMKRMRYPESFKGDSLSERDRELQEHRKYLKSHFVKIVKSTAVDLVLPFLKEVVSQVFDPNALFNLPAYQVEVSLAMLIAFGEGAPSGVIVQANKSMLERANVTKTHMEKSIQRNPADAHLAITPADLARAAAEDERRAKARHAFRELIAVVHRAQLWNHPHPRVVMSYNEITARYVSFVTDEYKDLVGPILQGLVSHGGIKHPDAKVRSQACYLLLKIVKGLGSAIVPFSGDLFGVLVDKLVISYDAVVAEIVREELQEKILEAETVELQLRLQQQQRQSQEAQPEYSLEDTNNLIETSSYVIVLNSKNPETANVATGQLELVMRPILTQLEEIVQNVQSGVENPRQRLIAGNWASECVRALGALVKGLPPSAAIGDLVKKSLTVALTVVHILADHEQLSSRVFSMLHASIPVLGDAAVEFAPGIGVQLLEQSKRLDPMLNALQFLNQLVSTFKQKLEPTMDRLFLPVLRHVFSVLQSVPDPFLDAAATAQPALTSQSVKVRAGHGGLGALSTEQMDYRRAKNGLILFLYTLIAGDLDTVLSSPTNVAHLEEVFKFVLETIASFPDTDTQSCAVKIVDALSDLWLSADKRPHLDPAVRSAFARLMMEQASVATFRATTVSSFSTENFQCIQLLDQMSRFHQALARLIGDDFLQHLAKTALPSVSCPPQVALDYAQKVGDKSLSSKDLSKHFKSLLLS